MPESTTFHKEIKKNRDIASPEYKRYRMETTFSIGEKADKIYKSVSVNNYVLYRKEFLTVCKLFYIGNRLLLYPYVDNIVQSF